MKIDCEHDWQVVRTEMGVNLSKCSKCGREGIVMDQQSDYLLSILGEPKIAKNWPWPRKKVP